ncbi:hypothetical protein M6B38_227030 [Iris pallida]|uniref:Uncharacterized protein n=1 Tax=Iris pallida TaxID=29817 RepID=A0AAX6DTL5_IRIPA|nr:hypothetical protein M6B38_227030 [Iris pallida]
MVPWIWGRVGGARVEAPRKINQPRRGSIHAAPDGKDPGDRMVTLREVAASDLARSCYRRSPNWWSWDSSVGGDWLKEVEAYEAVACDCEASAVMASGGSALQWLESEVSGKIEISDVTSRFAEGRSGRLAMIEVVACCGSNSR